LKEKFWTIPLNGCKKGTVPKGAVVTRATRILFVLFVSLLTLVAAGSAFAQSFEISWSTPAYGSGSGNFAATNEGGGTYLLTSIISGSQAGDPMTLLPINGYGGNDNLVFPTATGLVDVPGFSIVAGGIDYNIYDNGGTYYECSPLDNLLNCPVGSGHPMVGSGVLKITATPEPSTILLFLSGFGALLIFVARKASA
jgi:hypothetical protein